MQPENFIRSHKNPLSHKVGGQMVHWALLCNRVAVESLACRPLGWAWRAWDPGVGALLGTVLCLVSGQRGGCVCSLFLTQGWPACLVLHTHSSPPTLLDCNPGVWFVTPVLTTSFSSEPGFDLTSQDPVSVEVCYPFRSMGYYPHSIPDRWFISTLADLCIVTFWLNWAPGPFILVMIENPHLDCENVHINIQAMNVFFSKTLNGEVLALISIWNFEKMIIQFYFASHSINILFYLRHCQHNVSIRLCPLFFFSN